MQLNKTALLGLAETTLAEDAPWGDITTESCFEKTAIGSAVLVARENAMICGTPWILAVAACIGDLDVKLHCNDGDRVTKDTTIAKIDGTVWSLLRAERVMLNFLSRLSGIATQTRAYVDAVDGSGARIVDTRKTTPGLRQFEKYAVVIGGGATHRFCLSDAVMLKDNHLALISSAGRDLGEVLIELRSTISHTTTIEVEIDRLEQIEPIVATGVVDTVLLDNFCIADLQTAVRRIDGRARTEASGGITLDSVRDVAETGVDFISVGALTHSSRSCDFALDFC